MDNKNINSHYDSLDSWREENFTSLAGGCEYDATAEAIKKYTKKQKLQATLKNNEHHDSLNGWREENFTSYAGGSEDDPTARAIIEEMKKQNEQKNDNGIEL